MKMESAKKAMKSVADNDLSHFKTLVKLSVLPLWCILIPLKFVSKKLDRSDLTQWFQEQENKLEDFESGVATSLSKNNFVIIPVFTFGVILGSLTRGMMSEKIDTSPPKSIKEPVKSLPPKSIKEPVKSLPPKSKGSFSPFKTYLNQCSSPSIKFLGSAKYDQDLEDSSKVEFLAGYHDNEFQIF
jgi:hypothetical protein